MCDDAWFAEKLRDADDVWFAEKLAPGGDGEDGLLPPAGTGDEAVPTRRDDGPGSRLGYHATGGELGGSGSGPTTPLGSLMDALVELRDTDALIRLIQAIKELPESGAAAVADGKLWRGLPGFADLYADTHQWRNWRSLYSKTSSALEQKQLRDYHVKKAKVETHLAAAGLSDIPIDWGYEVVADALERDDALLDLEMPAAAEWLTTAGWQFREGAARREHSWALGRQRDLWEQDSSMTRERYSFWTRRLDELQKAAETSAAAAVEAAAQP